MFCPNCGKEVEGNFCSGCGVALSNREAPTLDGGCGDIEIDQTESEAEEYSGVVIIADIEVNLYSIIRMYGEYKLGAYTWLANQTGVPFDNAKKIMDEAYEHFGSLDEITFFSKAKEQAKQQKQKNMIVVQPGLSKKERMKQMDADGVAYCPKCLSISLSANKKGFGIGKAVIGGIAGVSVGGAIGLIGLTAGNSGAKKVRVTCLKCGHHFWAGK